MEQRINLEFTELEITLLLGMMNNTLDVVEADLDDPDRRKNAKLVIKLIERMLNELNDKYDEKEDSIESHS